MQKEYFIVSSHREEVVDKEENLKSLIESLNALVEKYNYPVIFQPIQGLRKNLIKIQNLDVNPKISFFKTVRIFDYINLQKMPSAHCLIQEQ